MKFLVFSDDWGRHPSSCQHLIRQLLPDHQVTWVNTIGMRPPRLDLITLRRGFEKLRGWAGTSAVAGGQSHDDPIASNSVDVASDRVDAADPLSQAAERGQGPNVIDAKMWPWMSHSWDRWLNRWLLSKQLRLASEDAIVITTIPIVADLVGRLPAARWVYYCVDDFSVWPGLDGEMLGRMEDELVAKVDCTIAVSDTLMESLRRRGCSPHLLTHGVDLDFWRTKEVGGKDNGLGVDATPANEERDSSSSKEPASNDVYASETPGSDRVLFWGVVDRRMNADWVLALADSMDSGKVILAGPHQDPDPRLLSHQRVRTLGALPFEELPQLAATADVLIMPYADLPVTRAMQPLKLKEYLATGKPVVVSPLPATAAWEDCLYIVHDQASFIAKVHSLMDREHQPTGERTLLNKTFERLKHESWSAKAAQMLGVIGEVSQRANSIASG
ncbi:glycosyltransferase [Stieleria sp. JC731]|uniref:glycosyltransferase n=1 Tax=Stieleria sp. JC731 TaxID=2894195 RepID=UPI001E593442|nr:glycosyltransferase [Stieleria sp. JC731]MCC9601464.1 glycosyltransferase [Stieleria sp. JC731]